MRFLNIKYKTPQEYKPISKSGQTGIFYFMIIIIIVWNLSEAQNIINSILCSCIRKFRAQSEFIVLFWVNSHQYQSVEEQSLFQCHPGSNDWVEFWRLCPPTFEFQWLGHILSSLVLWRYVSREFSVFLVDCHNS